MFHCAGRAHRERERERAALPLGVEDGLVGLGLDRPEAVHAAHVVDAVHDATASGRAARPVPIIESRVTSAARSSSLQPSVPSGRIGTTR